MLMLGSCEQLFEFSEDEASAEQYIVNGVIDQSPGPYFVNVQQTTKGLSQVPKDIANARVELVDEDGNREACAYREDGIYRCDGQVIKGRPGAAYRVEVQVEDVLIKSTMDRMPSQSIPRHSLTWEQGKLTNTTELGFDVQIDVVYVSLEAEVIKTTSPIYLNWVGEEIYQFLQKEFINATQPPCYVIENYGSDQVRLLSNEDFSGRYFLKNTLFRELDDSFLRKHIISIFQYAISEPFYRYQQQLKKLIENGGSLFDTPPGLAQGNLLVEGSDEPVNGYFRAVLVDTASVAIYPSQLENVRIVDSCIRDFSVERCNGCPNTGKYSGFDRPEYYSRID